MPVRSSRFSDEQTEERLNLARARRRRANRDTIALIIFSVVTGFVSIQIDLFETLAEATRSYEAIELDEIFSVFIMLTVLLLAYTVRRISDLRHMIEAIDRIDQQRQQLNDRLSEAIQLFDAGFALWDADDKLILCNHRYREMFAESADIIAPGISFSELMGRHFMTLAGIYPDEDLSEARAIRERCHREGGFEETSLPSGVWLKLQDNRTREGGTVSLRTDISDVKERESVLEQMVKDVELQSEDLKRMAEELGEALHREKESAFQAEAASRAKSRFLATMSHELRTPLNAIIGFSEIIKDRSYGPNADDLYFDYAKEIHDSGVHLLDIINDILELSKMDSGNTEIDRVQIYWPMVVRQCTEIFKDQLKRDDIALVWDESIDLEAVYADERSLRQILANILSNAVKFTPSGGEIKIGGRRSEDGWAELTIRDTGEGIPRSEIDRMFRPFERATNLYSSNQGGAGLGLSIVKKLMEIHGGTVGIDSDVGLGTTVTLRFPRSNNEAWERYTVRQARLHDRIAVA